MDTKTIYIIDDAAVLSEILQGIQHDASRKSIDGTLAVAELKATDEQIATLEGFGLVTLTVEEARTFLDGPESEGTWYTQSTPTPEPPPLPAPEPEQPEPGESNEDV